MKKFGMTKRGGIKAIHTAVGADFLYANERVWTARRGCALDTKKEIWKTEFQVFAQRGDFF